MVKETVTLEETAAFLNHLLEVDPLAISALFNIRVYCNQDLAEHPTVQVGGEGSGKMKCHYVGIIGLLNGLFGADDDGWGHLAVTMDNGKIISFDVLDETKIAKLKG